MFELQRQARAWLEAFVRRTLKPISSSELESKLILFSFFFFPLYHFLYCSRCLRKSDVEIMCFLTRIIFHKIVGSMNKVRYNYFAVCLGKIQLQG